MGKTELFDLEKHFAFYSAYHSNPVNKIIHMLIVWLVVFTSLVLCYFTPSFFTKVVLFGHPLVFNLGFLLTLIYAVFYVCLDKKAGSLGAFLCFACWVYGSSVANYLGFSVAWKVVLAAHLFFWIGQVIGHGVFEKRAPAILDNLIQNLVMGPFFVLLEALHMLFNYEPYPGFHAAVKAEVQAEIKQWQDREQKKIT